MLLLLRRRDSRVATIKALPPYATTEAAALQEAIATRGSVGPVSRVESASLLFQIEPARDEAYFRERISRGGRPLTSPMARLRRARIKPVRPKPLTAPRPRPGLAPPKMVLVHASRCRICGRPLTNFESRRRGVGPDCYRKYGARVVHVANPAFAEWSNRKRVMESQQVAWQELLDELYEHLMQRFEIEMRNWSEASRPAAALPGT